MKCERVLLKNFFNLFNLNEELIFIKLVKFNISKKKFLTLKND